MAGLLDIIGLDPRAKRAHKRELEKLALMQQYGLDLQDRVGNQALDLERTRGTERRQDISHELDTKAIDAIAAKYGVMPADRAAFAAEFRNIAGSNLAAGQSEADANRNRAGQIASRYGAGSGVATMPPSMQKILEEQVNAIENQPALKNIATPIGNSGAQLMPDSTSGPLRFPNTMPFIGERADTVVNPVTGMPETTVLKEQQPGLSLVTPEMRAAAEAELQGQTGIGQGTNISNQGSSGVAASPAPASPVKTLPPGLPPGLQISPDAPMQMQAPPTPQEVEAARKRRDMARMILPQGGNIRQLFKPGDVGSGGRLTGGGIRQAPQPTEDLGALQQYLIRELSRNPELAKQLGLQ